MRFCSTFFLIITAVPGLAAKIPLVCLSDSLLLFHHGHHHDHQANMSHSHLFPHICIVVSFNAKHKKHHHDHCHDSASCPQMRQLEEANLRN